MEHAWWFGAYSMFVDFDRLRRIEFPRGQMVFFNDVPWQNNANKKKNIKGMTVIEQSGIDHIFLVRADHDLNLA